MRRTSTAFGNLASGRIPRLPVVHCHTHDCIVSGSRCIFRYIRPIRVLPAQVPERVQGEVPYCGSDWFGVAYWPRANRAAYRRGRKTYPPSEVGPRAIQAVGTQCRAVCRIVYMRLKIAKHRHRCPGEFRDHSRGPGFRSCVSWHPRPFGRGRWVVTADLRPFPALQARGFSRCGRPERCQS